MQVENTKRIRERIGRLVNDRNLNAAVARYLTPSLNGAGAPKDMEELQKAGAAYREMMEKTGLKLTDSQAAVLTMINGLTKDHRKELYRNPADELYVLSGIAANSRTFKADEFASDPYLRDVKLNNANAGEYRFGQIAFMPGQLFFYNTPKRVMPRTVELPRVAYLEEKALFPAVLKDRRAARSVTPNEIITVAPHIKAARGNVLALGGGMGYFAYMASLKPEVQSVTVIEKDPALVELLEEHILPQLQTADKIRVLEDDPCEFISDLEDDIYDCCFLNYGDIGTYLSVVKECRRFKNMKTTYWIEDAFCISLITFVYLEILGTFNRAAGMKEPDLSGAPEAEKERMAMVSELLKDAKIVRPEQIDYYMDPSNLVYLLR